MSLPRQVVPGTTYMVQRRCTQRQFLLQPDATVNQTFLYCLAYAAKKTGVVVHCFCVLSNHYHAVLTDPRGRLPDFAHLLHKLVASCLNCYHKRRENFWSSEPFSAVRLETRETVLEKMVYALANPVEARLVDSGSKWPGLRSSPEVIGRRELEARRPEIYFRKTKMPEKLTLRLQRPPQFRRTPRKEFPRDLAQAVEGHESELRRTARARKQKFMGVAAIRRQKPESRPRSAHGKLGKLNPRIACGDKWKRIERLMLYVEFLSDYAQALERYRDGEHDVVFPEGTYWMRVHFNVSCEGTPGPRAGPT